MDMDFRYQFSFLWTMWTHFRTFFNLGLLESTSIYFGPFWSTFISVRFDLFLFTLMNFSPLWSILVHLGLFYYLPMIFSTFEKINFESKLWSLPIVEKLSKRLFYRIRTLFVWRTKSLFYSRKIRLSNTYILSGWNHRGVYILSRKKVLETKIRRKLSPAAHRRMRMDYHR